MSTVKSRSPDQEMRTPLTEVEAALVCHLGADGVYARTALCEGVLQRLDAYVSRQGDPRREVLRFPPVMSRAQLEKSGYLKSFPDLLGCVCALHGTESDIRSAADLHETGGDWTQALRPSDLVLTPAACYPVYPLAAERGTVPEEGLLFDLAADCFRHEPSRSLDRLQSFRMRELVRMGDAEAIQRFREEWMSRARSMMTELELPCELAVANDPFFGRVGQVMAVSQRHQSLKFELLISYYPGAKATACMSFNYHRDHFGLTWDLRDVHGRAAHTSCVAFGMDRLVIALFCLHGLDPGRWPASVKRALDI